MKTVNMTPTWEFAVKVYIAVLENPKAEEEAKQGARDDLLRLGRTMDRVTRQNPKVRVQDLGPSEEA